MRGYGYGNFGIGERRKESFDYMNRRIGGEVSAERHHLGERLALGIAINV